MFGRERASKSPARTGEQRAQRSIRPRGPTRTIRLSVMVLLLLSFTPLGLGILISLPPAQLAGGLRTFSGTPAHIVSAVARYFDLAQSPVPEVAKMQGPHRSWAAPAVFAEHEGNVLSYGDRLKITFYEGLGVTIDARGGSSDQTVAAIYPRMDLSAEYSVDERGSLAIPRLGQFNVAGQGTVALQSTLAAAFERVIGRSGDVHVAIVERQPVYVLGTVRNAGTFKHVPGMTVLQALADAGGINSGISDTSRAIEGIRETQRLRQTEARLYRMLLNQARLVALRDDSDSLTIPAILKTRLAESTSQDGLAALVTGAQATLTIERARYQQQLSLAERQVRIAQVEIEAQTTRMAQVSALLAKKSDRLRDLEGIAAHGSVSQLKLTDVGADVADVTARREDLRVALVQSERRLVEAEIALAKLQFEHSADIDRELATTQQEIDDSTQAIASMHAVTQVLRDGTPEAAAPPADGPQLKITRRLADGIAVMPATESTVLLPGDVVQVNFAGSANHPDDPPAPALAHRQN